MSRPSMVGVCRFPLRLGLVVLAVPLAACRIEKTPMADASRSATSVFINDTAFDPDAMVAADWDGRVLPGLRDRAGPYDEVADAVAKDPSAAGARYGFHEEAGAPWTYAARIAGVITAADTGSRAATIDVRTDGGRTVTLQIGPVVRGTAIRDSLALRPFGSFKNQIDYAQYGKALNAKANAVALSKLPREGLVGRRVDAVGAFGAGAGGAPPLVTPVEIHLEPRA